MLTYWHNNIYWVSHGWNFMKLFLPISLILSGASRPLTWAFDGNILLLEWARMLACSKFIARNGLRSDQDWHKRPDKMWPCWLLTSLSLLFYEVFSPQSTSLSISTSMNVNKNYNLFTWQSLFLLVLPWQLKEVVDQKDIVLLGSILPKGDNAFIETVKYKESI